MNIASLYQIYQAHPIVTTDSRRCPEGSMFFALRGDTFDGNKFAAKALETGCAVAVVDDASVIPEDDGRYILVDDVLATLQQLAAHHRQQFHKPVIQVTGTNGKTTTKELLAAVLGQRYNVLYTQGNLNNHIGVPLTLLRLTAAHDIAIIETGANHPGEIAFLSRIVDADYGLITNVGRAHLEGFGSFEGVKRTKGELYDYLLKKPSGRIFANASNEHLMAMLNERGAKDPLLYGRDKGYGNHGNDEDNGRCDMNAAMIASGNVLGQSPFLQVRWTQPTQGGHYEVETQLIGDYNIDNVLAAIAVGLHFGVPSEDINEALASYHPSMGRSEYRQTAHNDLIVDAYNANPTSMRAALDNFRHLTRPHKMVILGDMRELGADSDSEHTRIVAELIGSDIEEAWLVGPNFGKATLSLPSHADDTSILIRTFPDVGAVKATLADTKPTGKCILIKGSNGTRLFELPDLL